jgi:hypothetical protein
VQLKDPKQHMVASKYNMLLLLTVLEIKLGRFLLHLIVQLSFHFCQPILHPILQKEKEMLQLQNQHFFTLHQPLSRPASVAATAMMMMIHRDRFEACILEKMAYLLTDQIRYTDIYLKLANWRRWAICPTDQNRTQNTQQVQTILNP